MKVQKNFHPKNVGSKNSSPKQFSQKKNWGQEKFSPKIFHPKNVVQKI